MKQKTIISGLSVHLHHEILVEHCTDYDERVDYIKSDKPKHEIKIRIEVFKMLSKEAIKALPKELVKAIDDWNKANADLNKAVADRNKAIADLKNAYADWKKADAAWKNAYAAWDKAIDDWNKANADWDGKEKWHKKFCGCRYWNGKELVFK